MSLPYQVHIYHEPAVFNVSGGGHAGTVAAFMNESDALDYCKRMNCRAASYRVIMTRDGYDWVAKHLPEIAEKYEKAHL